MMETFDRHQVAFVAVTQQFNTATSMGRLVLNVLLSFAQFEREIIAERTRDKFAAARRKGKWSGGHPLLGYDVAPVGLRLRVNRAEARRVRAIFALYLRYQGLLPVVQELARRGWVTKAWRTRRGTARGGRPFTKPRLYALLRNVTYIGRVRYKDEVHPGEHEGIVDQATWDRVQALLRRPGRAGVTGPQTPSKSWLRGLLRCAPCGCAMTPSHSCKHPGRRYRYYVCGHAQRRGWHACPSKALSAPAIEEFVLQRLKGMAHDPAFLQEALAQTAMQSDRGDTGAQAALTPGDAGARPLTVTTLAEALAGLASGWDTLAPEDQVRLVRQVVDRVDYDGRRGQAAITFREAGLAAWVEAWTRYQEQQL
jgi:site-specific DNA recombinase